ncbi:hypothetical protein KSF73_00630 [Burkholderiaceae bacterium DAT-1]|nr:hypothetical protein [Burkholderiaceae bacterium DAT-1]
MKRTLCAAAVLGALLAGCNSKTTSPDNPNTTTPTTAWSVVEAPTASTIGGGPWTLTQLATGNTDIAKNPSFGYCNANGLRTRNPGVAAMNPYASVQVVGTGLTLQAFFDYRPYGLNESIVAAASTDGGKTWKYQQEAAVLTEACPANSASLNPTDGGVGKPYVMTVGTSAYMYAVDHSTNNTDSSAQLLVQPLGLSTAALAAQPAAPLQWVGATAASLQTRTFGLLNPAGILAVIPAASSGGTRVLYLSKIVNGDNTGVTAMDPKLQCPVQPVAPAGAAAVAQPNHDIITVRVADTYDGKTFVDRGVATGLNDSTAVGYDKIRYVGSNGTVVNMGNGKYGLFFTGGNCLDANSDGQHFVAYAESTDTLTWTIINGADKPIASIKNVTVGTTVYPATVPVVTAPASNNFYLGRISSPAVSQYDNYNIILTFSGSPVDQPVQGLANYRQIGRMMLKSNNVMPTPYVY